MPNLTATVYPDEAYVLIQADWANTLLWDSFTRVVVDDWGAATTGQDWALLSGAAASCDVDGTRGLQTHTASNSFILQVADLTVLDSETSGIFWSTSVPVGGNMAARIMARFVDGSNFLEVRVFQNAAGTATAVIRQVVGGVVTSSSTATLAGLGNTGAYRYRFRVQGASTFLRVWDAAVPEPSTWNVTFTTTWLTAGSPGLGSLVEAAVTTPPPIVYQFDDFLVTALSPSTSDCAIVTRRNTVTGEVAQLRPYISYDANGALLLECGQGLWWDTEPPLNVELEYCTTACDQPVTITANPDFDTSAAGWTATGGALAQDCAVAKVGTCSGSFTPTGTAVNPSISQTGTTIAANSTVTISTWARTAQGWNSVFLRLAVTYDDFTTQNFDTPMVTLDDNEWRYLAITFTTDKAVASFTFSFIMAGQPPNTTIFKVDDLKVTVLTPVGLSDCVTVTVASESVWLKNPLHPCLDVEVGLCSPMLLDCEETARVSYVGTTDDNYSPNTVLLSPVNRQHPIPTNRIRRSPTATLRLLAHDCDAKDAVLAINEPGDPLLFQAPADYCIPDRYISVGALDETRFSVDQREDFRLMTLPYATVERPAGPADGVCGARIEDLCDIYTSWGALAMAGLTWEDLLLGEASPDGPGQPDPPVGARTWGDVETEFADWLAVEAGGTRDWGELRDGL